MNNFRKMSNGEKTLQVEVSNATPMQVQTLKIELMLMAKQWFRKVKVRIKVK